MSLVLTVDCGITAVDEVAEARRLGLDVIVTDHHRPGETLPDCPIVATRPSRYPFPELCGTGVAYKLLAALGADVDRHLDLVALATIADVVPLLDENRALAAAGLRALARTQKPGLQALMRAARVDPAAVDTGAVGFRLAPRINAAGRLGHPAEALELLLTDDRDEAARLASKLEELNRERQAVEDRILREAVAKVGEWSEAEQRQRAYVLADEGWHEGVIGIVASRLVERFHRPVVMIAGGDGEWKGSGRSVSTFDLHAGLAACAAHLERFGGHRAAAGLSIRAGSDRRVRPRLRGLCRRAAGRRRPASGHVRRRRPAREDRPDAGALRGARGARAVRPRESRDHAARRELRAARPRDGRRGEASALPRSRRRRDRVRPRRPARPLSRRRTLRRRVPARGEPVERDGRARSSSSAASSTRTRATRACAPGSSRSSARTATADAVAQEIFDELGLADGSGPRSLLESERFRALLEEPALARAA